MDAYQQAVEYLTANPERIRDSWRAPYGGYGGCLFKVASPNGNYRRPPDYMLCGCLTSIRLEPTLVAWTDELTRAIRGDGRLPDMSEDITPDHLPIFASWQRHIDVVLKRLPPALDERIPPPAKYVRDVALPGISIEVQMARGMTALIDTADKELVGALSWSPHQGKAGTWYARGYRRGPAGERQWVYMHRLICSAQRGQMVDHINRDGLDNRRQNLRLCDGTQNNANRRTGKSTSRYRGVSLAANGKWLAQIMKDRKQKYLGQHESELDAARAYNTAAAKMFGDFATLNDIPMPTREVEFVELPELVSV